MLDFSWITQQIAVSGAFTDDDIPHLNENKIDAVIDIRSEYYDNKNLLHNHGIDYLNIPVDDRYSPSITQLEQIFTFIEPLLNSRKKILVHCQNGCGRSTLTVAAILAKKGVQISDAINLLKEKHPRTSFTIEQEKFIYIDLVKYFNKDRT